MKKEILKIIVIAFVAAFCSCQKENNKAVENKSTELLLSSIMGPLKQPKNTWVQHVPVVMIQSQKAYALMEAVGVALMMIPA